MTFDEYLTEAFGFRDIAYGTNHEADDGKFNTGHDRVWTYMEYNGQRLTIGCSKVDGEVMFTNTYGGIKPARDAKSGLDFYNRIAFVLLKVIEHAKVNKIFFQGDEDHGLRDLYDKFIRNPSFMRLFNSKGWHYDGEKFGGDHHFSKGSK
ncbi:hypothetical protein [Xanthomonas phage BUDD]|nr:hypothetical protein [Xanthomonas phage BUDD]